MSYSKTSKRDREMSYSKTSKRDRDGGGEEEEEGRASSRCRSSMAWSGDYGGVSHGYVA